MNDLLKRTLNAISVLAITVIFSSLAWAETYSIDKNHSSIGFGITHLMVSTVRGVFNDHEGAIQFDPTSPEATAADVTIKTASINTQNADRDKHLSSPDFFDIEKYPTITFKSKTVKKEGDGYLFTGDLTIHGVTKEIMIPVTINGPVKGPKGNEIIGLSGQTKINRQDFGITWNKQLDQGGYMLSDDVAIEVNIEADTPVVAAK